MQPLNYYLSQLQNAVRLKKLTLILPNTKLYLRLSQFFVDQGFFSSFAIHSNVLIIQLKYSWDGTPLFYSLQVVSKKRVRIYRRMPTPFIQDTIGQIFVYSTNLGFLTLEQCGQQRVGGEVAFIIHSY